jgi:hypothetical protein
VISNDTPAVPVMSLVNPDTKGEPYAPLVTMLERMLADARAGTLRGVAYAAWRDDEAGLSTGWIGAAGSRFPLGHGVAMLAFRFAQADLTRGIPTEPGA